MNPGSSPGDNSLDAFMGIPNLDPKFGEPVQWFDWLQISRSSGKVHTTRALIEVGYQWNYRRITLRL